MEWIPRKSVKRSTISCISLQANSSSSLYSGSAMHRVALILALLVLAAFTKSSGSVFAKRES
jgi:hypothetical protein